MSRETESLEVPGSPEGFQLSVTVEGPCPAPMVYVTAEGTVVGPHPLPNVIAAYIDGRIPRDAKIRVDGDRWHSIADMLPHPPVMPTKAEIVREQAMIQIPLMSAFLMPWVTSTHSDLDMMLGLTLVASAALNTYDGVKLGCIPRVVATLPLAFLIHLVTWPVSYPMYMAHRSKDHGRITFGQLPWVAMGCLAGCFFMGHWAMP